MTKEILLSLKGLQIENLQEEEQELETITFGEYYKRSGSHYVIYEEVTEGFSEVTKNMIKFKGNSLEVSKKGLFNVHMIFEEKKKNMTSYATPYGNILFGIDTRNVKIKEEQDHIRVYVDYALEANYQHLADCRIEMNVCSREMGPEL